MISVQLMLAFFEAFLVGVIAGSGIEILARDGR
jgi:hypothetical protein